MLRFTVIVCFIGGGQIRNAFLKETKTILHLIEICLTEKTGCREFLPCDQVRLIWSIQFTKLFALIDDSGSGRIWLLK